MYSVIKVVRSDTFYSATAVYSVIIKQKST